MQSIALRAHFDGEQILLDEPYELEPNTRLIVTVLSSEIANDEREGWYSLSQQPPNAPIEPHITRAPSQR